MKEFGLASGMEQQKDFLSTITSTRTNPRGGDVERICESISLDPTSAVAPLLIAERGIRYLLAKKYSSALEDFQEATNHRKSLKWAPLLLSATVFIILEKYDQADSVSAEAHQIMAKRDITSRNCDQSEKFVLERYYEAFEKRVKKMMDSKTQEELKAWGNALTSNNQHRLQQCKQRLLLDVDCSK